ncbi:MAG: effector-binding domain-containing protein [Patiriisocius sp.]|jgi:effector-binding domain-containing protein
MKALKILLFLFVIIAVAIGVLSYISPKDIHAYESLEIDASPAQVYPYISNLAKMGQWSPWMKKDPNSKTSITGTDGTLGAVSSWDSEVKDVGKGSQEITNLVQNERIDLKLNMIKPYELEAMAYVSLDEKDGKTIVTWGMKTQPSFPANIFMKFNEGVLRNDYTDGLNMLRDVVIANKGAASESKPKNKYTFKEMNMPAKTYVMKREVVKMEDMTAFYSGNLGNIYAAVGAAGVEIDGMPCGLYFDWNEEKGETDMAAAVPVKSDMNAEGYETFVVPGGMCLMVHYKGPYEDSESVHYAIADYMKANGYEQNGIVLEEYLNDTSSVSDSSELLTNVYYYVKKLDA